MGCQGFKSVDQQSKFKIFENEVIGYGDSGIVVAAQKQKGKEVTNLVCKIIEIKKRFGRTEEELEMRVKKEI